MWKVYFNSTKSSGLEANSDINGIKVSVSRDSKQLIVENVDACDETDAHQKAHGCHPILKRLTEVL